MDNPPICCPGPSLRTWTTAASGRASAPPQHSVLDGPARLPPLAEGRSNPHSHLFCIQWKEMAKFILDVYSVNKWSCLAWATPYWVSVLQASLKNQELDIRQEHLLSLYTEEILLGGGDTPTHTVRAGQCKNPPLMGDLTSPRPALAPLPVWSQG